MSQTTLAEPRLLKEFKVKFFQSGHETTLSEDGRQWAVYTGPWRQGEANEHEDMAVTFFDTASGKRIDKLPCPYEVKRFALLPEPGVIAIGGQVEWLGGKSALSIIDLGAQELRHSWEMSGRLERVSLRPDGLMCAASANGCVKVVDPTTFEEKCAAQIGKRFSDATVSPDMRFFLTCVGDTAELWDMQRQDVIATVTLNSIRGIKDVSFSSDGSKFLVFGDVVNVHDTETAKELFVLGNQNRRAVAFSPCSRFVMVVNGDGTLDWLDARTGETVETFSAFKTLLSTVGGWRMHSTVTEEHWFLAAEKRVWELPIPR